MEGECKFNYGFESPNLAVRLGLFRTLQLGVVPIAHAALESDYTGSRLLRSYIAVLCPAPRTHASTSPPTRMFTTRVLYCRGRWATNRSNKSLE